MKVSEMSVLSLMIGLVIILYLYISCLSSSSLNEDMVFAHHGEKMLTTKPSRKLKESGNHLYDEKNSNAGEFHVDDYSTTDPTPVSKDTVKPGPIEHGTPVIPYIPKPSPSPPPQPLSPPPSQPGNGFAPIQTDANVIAIQPPGVIPP